MSALKMIVRISALLLLAAGEITQGQGTQTSAQSDSFQTIKARTQVVLLDVVATDPRGNPVTDLKREDFTILEKGKPQKLASFNLVDVVQRAAAYKSLPPPKLPAGVFTNKQEALQEKGQLVVLLLDSLNTPWADQSYARGQMLKYLRKNHPVDEKMAIYYLANRLYRLQDFTTDPNVLEKVLQKHKGDTSPLIDNPDDAGTDTSIVTAEMAAGVAAMEEQEAAFRMDIRVRMTLDALKAIGQVLGGYPGRKKLIWVSGSFPVQIAPGENSGFNSQRSYGSEIMQTTSLLRESRVSVYTIDAAGLVGAPLANAAFAGRTSAGRVMTGPQLQAESLKRMNALQDAHASAKQMAEETGGLAFYNRNDLDTAVMKSVADGAIYYALSYSPEDKALDGQYRKIEVKVNRPGVELRYRKGYYARDARTAEDESPGVIQRDMDAAMMTVLTASGVTFYGSATALEPPASNGRPSNPNAIKLAQVRFLVEPRTVFFESSQDGKHKCSLQFAVGVFNDEKIVKSAGKRLDCNVNPETYTRLLRDGIMFEMPVELTDQKARVRLLVRDNLSGKIGTLDVPYPAVTGKPAQQP